MAGFNELWNRVARDLPAGWQLCVTVAGAAAGAAVELVDPEGDDHEFPSNHEHLAEEVADALDYACEVTRAALAPAPGP